MLNKSVLGIGILAGLAVDLKPKYAYPMEYQPGGGPLDFSICDKSQEYLDYHYKNIWNNFYYYKDGTVLAILRRFFTYDCHEYVVKFSDKELEDYHKYFHNIRLNPKNNNEINNCIKKELYESIIYEKEPFNDSYNYHKIIKTFSTCLNEIDKKQ